MTQFLKPAEGRTVDQEDGSPWPLDGMDAPNTLFVRRRLRDGDLIDAERPVVLEEAPVAEEVTDPPWAETPAETAPASAGKLKGDK